MEEIRLVHFIIFILLIKELYFISFLMNNMIMTPFFDSI